MHFGLYYSQAQDWNHPGGVACSGHWDPAQEGSFDKYLDEVAVPQIKEILSAYQPEILWKLPFKCRPNFFGTYS
jgi:alpha-L-fucosidase